MKPTLRRLTNNLRWLIINGKPILQQMWIDQTTGTEHWEAIPEIELYEQHRTYSDEE